MEAEKRRSKGVGFLNLFDWNGKSRKKLFANNVEDSPGTQESKQGKENGGCLPKPGNYTVDADENEASSSNRESGDCNSTSCMTSDDGNGTIRAPSVVARLMGLDSLPTTSNVAEPIFGSTPLPELVSLRSSRSDFYTAEYVNIPNRLETISRNHIESRARKHHQGVPIERFQTEVLPPKSAKSIPITHHKLLSPIKNPGFASTKNVTYIMEAAAKIIEASPRSLAKSKVSSVVTPSVPLRIRDLKEKMEAANKAARPEKPKEVNASKYNRREHSNKSLNGSEYVLVTRGSTNSEKQNVHSARDKGRSASTSLRARTSSKSLGNRKEQTEVKSSQLKCQPNKHRSEKRTSPESSNNVLRQNNQKQNCVSNKDKSGGKNSVSNNPSRRTTRLSNGSSEPNKTTGKVSINSRTGLRKTGSVATSTERDVSSSAVKNVSQMKKHVSSEEADNRSIKCNVSMDSRFSMSPESRKPGMDVISFTFNSPLKSSRSPCESQSSGVLTLEKRFVDKDQQLYSNGFTVSSPGRMNVVGVDSLSALLEQKLLELTNKVQSYESKRVREESSASCASASEDSKPVQICVLRDKDKVDSTYSNDSPSADGPFLSMNNRPWQDREERCGSSNGIGKELDYDDISVESSFELSFESGSFASGSKGCLFSEVQSGGSLSYGNEFLQERSATKSSESTPSSSARSVNRRFGLEDLDNRPINWELEYVRNVLNNAELAMKDFALGDADEVITRNLFDHLENEEEERTGEECSKLGRKVLFDCVNECLESRTEQMYLGTCSRLGRLSPRREWLVEELYEEISGWKNMTDWMLDELVDKEMSTRTGRWLDFDKEAFEEGVEIERAILSSLVDELVFDLVIF